MSPLFWSQGNVSDDDANYVESLGQSFDLYGAITSVIQSSKLSANCYSDIIVDKIPHLLTTPLKELSPIEQKIACMIYHKDGIIITPEKLRLLTQLCRLPQMIIIVLPPENLDLSVQIGEAIQLPSLDRNRYFHIIFVFHQGKSNHQFHSLNCTYSFNDDKRFYSLPNYTSKTEKKTNDLSEDAAIRIEKAFNKIAKRRNRIRRNRICFNQLDSVRHYAYKFTHAIFDSIVDFSLPEFDYRHRRSTETGQNSNEYIYSMWVAHHLMVVVASSTTTSIPTTTLPTQIHTMTTRSRSKKCTTKAPPIKRKRKNSSTNRQIGKKRQDRGRKNVHQLVDDAKQNQRTPCEPQDTTVRSTPEEGTSTATAASSLIPYGPIRPVNHTPEEECCLGPAC